MRRIALAITAMVCSTLIGAALVISLAGPAATKQQDSASTANVAAITSMLEGCETAESWNACASARASEIADAVGISAMVEAVYRYADMQDAAQGFVCHNMMHAVGRLAAIAATEGITQALQPGELGCQLGFQHGVIEQTIDDAKSTDAALKVCDSLIGDKSLPSLIVGECFHAAGHGVVKNLGYVYDEALKICEAVKDNNFVPGCVSGVIMSWSNEYDTRIINGLEITDELKIAPPDRQWEVCRLLTRISALEGCVNFVAEKIPTNAERYKEFGAWCATELKLDKNCLTGIGRSVGGRLWYNPLTSSESSGKLFLEPSQVVTLCKAAAEGSGEDPVQCLYVAAAARGNFLPKTDFVKQLCALARPVPCERIQEGWDSTTKPRSEITTK